ncbi:4Fe-4S binding protein [bacterium]|nr:4Fe-4S binding protein [bacterium]
MGSLIYLKGVVTLELSVDKCNGCSMCGSVCPHGVFAIDERKAKIVDLDACMECGACAQNCPEGAISVRPGVGCAAAIIKGALKHTGSTSECCVKTHETCS